MIEINSNDHLTKSIDTITIEIANYYGRDYVEISRFNLKGKPAPMMFPKGDEVEACKFLSLLSELMGVGPVMPDKLEKKIT